MNKLKFIYLLVGIVLLIFALSCNISERSNVGFRFSAFESEEIQRIIGSVDEIVLAATNETIPDSAYQKLFNSYNDLCISSAFVSDIFNLLIQIQETSLFLEIWKLDWAMDVESGDRDLWLSFDILKGRFWRVLSEESVGFSGSVSESYNLMIERDIRNGFLSFCESFGGIEGLNDYEKAYIAIIIISHTINSF